MQNNQKSLPVYDPNRHLKSIESLFESTKNPVYAIDAFLIANDAEIPPPQWVLSWLLEGFKKYHQAKGEKTLDCLLGFKRKKGRNSAYEQYSLGARNLSLSIEIAILKGICGVSINDACLMIQARLKKSSEPMVAARRLQDLHAKDRVMQQVEGHFRGEPPEYWTEERKTNYLLRYPKDSLPPKIINRYRLKSHRVK